MCTNIDSFSLLQEHKLRALRYLPDIVTLQKILTERLYRRIDKERASQFKTRDFLQDLPKGSLLLLLYILTHIHHIKGSKKFKFIQHSLALLIMIITISENSM